MKHTIDNWPKTQPVKRLILYTADPDAFEDGIEQPDVLSLLGIRDLVPGV